MGEGRRDRRIFAMPSQDPAEWFDNVNVHVDDEELLAYAAELESTLLHGGSRIGTAVWTIVVSVIAGGFGGLTLSDEVRSSWPAFVAYLLGAAVFLRVIKPLSTRLVGARGVWVALFAAFWSVLLAMMAVAAGHIDTIWLGHTVSIACGLFIGLMYMSLSSAFFRSEDAWLLVALPLGALSAWSSSSVQRALDANANPAWSEAFVGTMAASVFIVPLAVGTALLASRASALAKLATLYLHNENFTAKAKNSRQWPKLHSKTQEAPGKAEMTRSTRCRAERRSDFPSELLLELAVAHLDHGGAAVGAAVGEFAGEQVLDQADEFGFAQKVVGLHGVAADGLCDHVFAEAELGGLGTRLTEIIDDLAEELRWVA